MRAAIGRLLLWFIEGEKARRRPKVVRMNLLPHGWTVQPPESQIVSVTIRETADA